MYEIVKLEMEISLIRDTMMFINNCSVYGIDEEDGTRNLVNRKIIILNEYGVKLELLYAKLEDLKKMLNN